MVAEIQINTLVNGRPVPAHKMADPFDLMAFPGAVDASRGKTLERLGRDISVVTKMLAKNDPDIEDIDVTFSVDGGALTITSNQTHRTGYSATDEYGSLIYRSGPKMYALQASLAVLHGHNFNERNTLNDIAFDIVKTWRERRVLGAGAFKNHISTTFGGTGLLATGFSLMGVGL